MMKDRNITQDLQRKTRKYLVYIWQNEDVISYTRDFFLNSMSSGIQEKFLSQAYFKILQKIPFFTKLSRHILGELCLIVKESVFTPEDIIYRVNLIFIIFNYLIYNIYHTKYKLLKFIKKERCL